MTVVVHGLAQRQICGVGGWSKDLPSDLCTTRTEPPGRVHHLVTSPKAKSGATVCVVS